MKKKGDNITIPLIYRVAYLNKSKFYWGTDQILHSLAEQSVDLNFFYSLIPPITSFDANVWYDLLISQNYITHFRHQTISITAKGKLFVKQGGYKTQAKYIILKRLFTLVATLGSIAAIISCLKTFV